jgi:hydroxycarboxylate dehydrogenase B
MLIKAERLRALLTTVLRAAESGEEEAAIVAEHLLEANLRGHDSHGAGMIPAYVRNCRLGRLRPNRHARFCARTAASPWWTARWATGR